MKCKYCDGTGKSKYGYNQPCTHCDGKGFVEPLTNEAWFCGLSTEEKAKWLSQRSQILYDCGQRDVFPKTMYEEDWEYWLKEKHHE